MSYKVTSAESFNQAQLQASGLLDGIPAGKISVLSCDPDPKNNALSLCYLDLPTDDVTITKKFYENLMKSNGGTKITTNSGVEFLIKIWDPTLIEKIKDGKKNWVDSIKGREVDVNVGDNDRVTIIDESYEKLVETLKSKIEKADPNYAADAVKQSNGSEKIGANANNKKADTDISQIVFYLLLLGGAQVVGQMLLGIVRQIPGFSKIIKKNETSAGGNQAVGQMKAAEQLDIVEIDKYTKNLTKEVLTDIENEAQGRYSSRAVGPTVESVIDQIDVALNKAKSANALLSTEAGGGKTETVKEYARRLVERGESNVHVKEIDLGAMMAGTQYRGMFESRLKTVLDDGEVNSEVQRLVDLAASTPTTESGKKAVAEARKEIVRQLRIKARDAGAIGDKARQWLKDWDGTFRNLFERLVERDYEKLSRELKNGNVEVIYFIDEVHTIIGAGNNKEGGLDASNMLKPLLASGKVRFIAATTKKEKEHVMRDGAFYRRFQLIEYGNASLEELELILKGGEFEITSVDKNGNPIKKKIVVGMSSKKYFENRHGVEYTDDAIKEIIRLSYAGDPNNPEKSNRAVAIDLMDSLGASKKVLLKKLKGQGLSDSEIKRHLKIDFDYVRKNYQEVTIGEPVKKLRAKLTGLEAEVEWLKKPMSGDSYLFPEKAEVEKRAEMLPVESRQTGPTTQVKNEQGQWMRFIDYKAALKERIVQQEESLAALRGMAQSEQKGLFGVEKKSELNTIEKPEIRTLLEEIESLKYKVANAKRRISDRSNIAEQKIAENVAAMNLNTGVYGIKPGESVLAWVDRLKKYRDSYKNGLELYEGPSGIRATIETIILKNIEYSRRLNKPVVTDEGLGLTDWVISQNDKMGSALLSQNIELGAGHKMESVPEIMQIPQMRPGQTPQDYLAVLKEVLAHSEQAVVTQNKQWDQRIEAEARRLMAAEMKDNMFVLALGENDKSIPQVVLQQARENVYNQQSAPAPVPSPNNLSTPPQATSLKELLETTIGDHDIEKLSKIKIKLIGADPEVLEAIEDLEQKVLASEEFRSATDLDRASAVIDALEIYKDHHDLLAKEGFRSDLVRAVVDARQLNLGDPYYRQRARDDMENRREIIARKRARGVY